jgi:hypothetical protein
MRYHDRQPIHVGDPVTIDVRHEGSVVARIEDGIYRQPRRHARWTRLRKGTLIDTSFAEPVRYPDEGGRGFSAHP